MYFILYAQFTYSKQGFEVNGILESTTFNIHTDCHVLGVASFRILRFNVHTHWVSLCKLSRTDVTARTVAREAHKRCIKRSISFAVASPSDWQLGWGGFHLWHDCLRMIERGKACRDMLIVFAISKALTAWPSQYLNPVYPSEAETAILLIVNLLIVRWPWASR